MNRYKEMREMLLKEEKELLESLYSYNAIYLFFNQKSESWNVITLNNKLIATFESYIITLNREKLYSLEELLRG